jgi:DNA-binding CsgD family transcriptional regulator
MLGDVHGMAKRRWPELDWWRHAALYGALLALGAVVLQWLDYRWLARTHSTEFYLLIVALGFLALGLYVGARVIGRPPPPRTPGNPQGQESLWISAREMAVLGELAAGYSNKEIARRLEVSPNTVKTHVARLFEKLGARRRTDAIARARELGLLS